MPYFAACFEATLRARFPTYPDVALVTSLSFGCPAMRAPDLRLLCLRFVSGPIGNSLFLLV